MARITVADCVTRVQDRFTLVLLAAQRVREIQTGAPLHVERDRDKNPVVALREIAEGHLYPDHLLESVIKGLQKHVTLDEEEQDVLNLLAEEQILTEQLGLEVQNLESEGLTITEGTPDQGE